MRITFDPAKNAKNVAERGLSFERAGELDWDTSVSDEDTRRDYGEKRLRVLARLDGRLHVAIVTLRGDATHVISFRKANSKEARWYAQENGRRSVTPG
jgi:uncharacterized DUF497 family protein